MKVTKDYLKKLILEELQEEVEKDKGSTLPPEEIERRRAAILGDMDKEPQQPSGPTAASTFNSDAEPPVTMQKRKPLQPNVQKLSAIYKDAWTQLQTIKTNLDTLTKDMADAGRMLKIQLEEDKKITKK